jgi:hypothetical protein
MNTGMIKSLLVALDAQLTGHSMVTARLASHPQEDKIESLKNWDKIEYYLSDGGYSRVWVDPFEGSVWLGDNSLVSAKTHWNDAGVQQIVTAIRRWLAAGRAEAEETEARAKLAREAWPEELKGARERGERKDNA